MNERYRRFTSRESNIYDLGYERCRKDTRPIIIIAALLGLVLGFFVGYVS